MRRRATTLVEVLCVLAIVVPVVVLGGQLLHSTSHDISQVGRATAAYGGLGRVVRQMQQDVDAGLSFPDTAGHRRASDNVLLIAQPGKVVCFTAGKDKISREEFVTKDGATDGPPAATRDWLLPNHKTSFTRVGGPDGRAVDIRMAVEVWADGKAVEKLATSRRLCLDSLATKAVRQ